MFYHQCEAGVAAAAFPRLGREPAAIGEEPLEVTPERYGRVPRTYIACRADRILPIAAQEAMAARHPPGRVLTLETDHSPFYSAPDALAGALDQLAREAAEGGQISCGRSL